jgi:hypothetical protein
MTRTLILFESAAKTAALLNGGHLDGSQLEIHTSAAEAAESKETGTEGHDIGKLCILLPLLTLSTAQNRNISLERPLLPKCWRTATF